MRAHNLPSLLALASLLYIFQLSSCKLLSFDIVRTKSPFHKILEMGLNEKNLEKILREVKNDSVPMFRYLDSEYYGKVLLGHPGQEFKVIFDTAWGNSWVPSSRCEVLDLACIRHKKYNKDKSSTHKDDGRKILIPYGDDSLQGTLVTDLIHIGSHNVSSQTFAEMTHIPKAFALLESDGILGMGFPSISYLNVTPFLDNMFLQGTIERKVFSFYFNRDKSSIKGGTLFLGGSEPRHYRGEFTYVNLIGADLWRIEVPSIHVKGSTDNMCGNKACPMIINTSEAQIKGPSDTIAKINAIIGARLVPLINKYKVSCSSIGKLPAVTFTFGGRNFQLKSRDYIVMVTLVEVTTCYSAFEPHDFPDPFKGYWTLGNSFMARYYVEFDADKMRVGFANVTN